MFAAGDVNQGKMEKHNRVYPSIDSCIWCDIRILKHAFNITSIDFNDEIPDSYKIDVQVAQTAIKSINFEFWLGETTHSLSVMELNLL